jgi:hypothetical protein
MDKYVPFYLQFPGQQPKSTYLFLGNVAMADLVTGVAVLFGQFYPRQYRDEMSCAIQIGEYSDNQIKIWDPFRSFIATYIVKYQLTEQY